MRAAVLANYLEVTGQLGVDAGAMLRRVGLRQRTIETPDALVPADSIVELLEETARISQCETIGLRLSQPRSMSGFGVVGLLMAQQRNIREALAMVSRYLPLINESLAIRLEESGDSALLLEEVLTDSTRAERQTIELALASNLKLFRTILGNNWAPRAIYLRHSAPKSMEEHHRVFRCPCVFDSWINGIKFARADLDAPNPAADPAMGGYAASIIESMNMSIDNSTIGRVKRLIHLLMPLQRASIKEVAQSLGISVRKLQLDLSIENSEFSAVLEDSRYELAQQYLVNSRYDVSQIASLLGYSQANSFTRWFSSKFGKPPTAWRISTKSLP